MNAESILREGKKENARTYHLGWKDTKTELLELITMK